jgi:hypothetical protein
MMRMLVHCGAPHQPSEPVNPPGRRETINVHAIVRDHDSRRPAAGHGRQARLVVVRMDRVDRISGGPASSRLVASTSQDSMTTLKTLKSICMGDFGTSTPASSGLAQVRIVRALRAQPIPWFSAIVVANSV